MAGLATEYRADSFGKIIGNKAVLKGLHNVLTRPYRIPSAFLFTGPAGTGKTTMARLIKKVLKCSDFGWIEMNSADERGIKDIRALNKDLEYSPLVGPVKIILLDEAHKLTSDAQEALLKALEEPPEGVYWILCTTEPESLKPTLKRRCHTYALELLKPKEILELLKNVLKSEGKEHFSNDVIQKIIELSNGSAGQALTYLDQVIDMDDTQTSLEILCNTTSSTADAISLSRVLSNNSLPPNTKWANSKKILKEMKTDGESSRRIILAYFNTILLNNGNDDTFFMMEPFRHSFTASGKPGLVMACYESIYGSGRE